MKRLATFTSLIFIHFLGGCFSSSEMKKEDTLDVALTKQPAQAKDQTSSDQAGVDPLVLPHGTQINWQQFFKALPSVDERKAIARALKNPLDNATVTTLVEAARKHAALGQLRAAEANLREALRKDVGNIEIMLDLVQIYLQRHDQTQAFEYLTYIKDTIDSSESVSKESVFLYRYALAVGYIQRGDRSRGHEILSDLIALDKEFVPGYSALASSYLQIGKDKVAEFIARRGLDRGQDDASLFNIIGVVETNRGDLVKARSYFDKALKVSPTFAPALVNRANTLLMDGDLDAAELNLVRAADYAPSDASVLVALGVCQKRMGRFEEARTSFEKALDAQPEDANARFNLGLLAMKNLDEMNVALRLFHEVLQVAQAPEELKALARVYIDDIKENKSSP